MKGGRKVGRWNKGLNSLFANNQAMNSTLNFGFFQVETLPVLPRFQLFLLFSLISTANPNPPSLNPNYFWSFLVLSSSLSVSLRAFLFILLTRYLRHFLRKFSSSVAHSCSNFLPVLLLVPIELLFPPSLPLLSFLWANLLLLLKLSSNFLFLFLFKSSALLHSLGKNTLMFVVQIYKSFP